MRYHALGIGHANFNNDFMSVMVNDESEDISHCDVNVALQVSQWKLSTFRCSPTISGGKICEMLVPVPIYMPLRFKTLINIYIITVHWNFLVRK